MSGAIKSLGDVLGPMGTQLREQDQEATNAPVYCVFSQDAGCGTPVQWFFTRKGAEQFIKNQRHTLVEPYIRVISAWRNEEWIAVRKLLRRLDLDWIRREVSDAVEVLESGELAGVHFDMASVASRLREVTADIKRIHNTEVR